MLERSTSVTNAKKMVILKILFEISIVYLSSLNEISFLTKIDIDFETLKREQRVTIIQNELKFYSSQYPEHL